MFSAYLFLAFIFGPSVLVESTTRKLEQIAATTTTTTISLKITGADIKNTDTVELYVPGDTTTSIANIAAGFAADQTKDTTAVEVGTQYDAYIKDTSSVLKAKVTVASKPAVPVVEFTSADSASAKYKVTNYDDAGYASVSVQVDSGTAKDFTSDVIDLTALESSKKLTIDVSGTKFDLSNEAAQTTLCTAPKAPTYTAKLEPDEQASSKYTLTVTIEFGAAELVSTMKIALGIDVPGTAPTTCDKTVCTDCADCTIASGSQDLTLTNSAATKGGLKFSVVLKDYPEADLKSEFKITAEYDTGCEAVGTIDAVKSLVNKIDRDVMVVYLAIGTMATVLRLLGIEVWTPLSSH